MVSVYKFRITSIFTGVGIAVKEYLTDVGPADYVLFVNKEPVGILEAKREEEAVKFSTHEQQVEDYAKRKNIPFEKAERWLGPVLGY